MAWATIDSETLVSTADDIAVNLPVSQTAKVFNELLENSPSTTNIINRYTYNDNTGTVYARRISENGGTDALAPNQDNMSTLDTSGVARGFFEVWQSCFISGEESLSMVLAMRTQPGAANAPLRAEIVFKSTVATPITKINANNTFGGDYQVGTNLNWFGDVDA